VVRCAHTTFDVQTAREEARVAQQQLSEQRVVTAALRDAMTGTSCLCVLVLASISLVTDAENRASAATQLANSLRTELNAAVAVRVLGVVIV
jgi:hypothetical protein